MTNEIATNAPVIIETVHHYTQAQREAWSASHSAISGGGTLLIVRYLWLEIPSVWKWLQDYCETHEGGIIVTMFSKIFGKKKQFPAVDPSSNRPPVIAERPMGGSGEVTKSTL